MAAFSQNSLSSPGFSPSGDRDLIPSPKKDTKSGASLGSGGILNSSKGASESLEVFRGAFSRREGVLLLYPDSAPESVDSGVVAGFLLLVEHGEADRLDFSTKSLKDFY